MGEATDAAADWAGEEHQRHMRFDDIDPRSIGGRLAQKGNNGLLVIHHR
jgi:hypothetical protein